MATNLNRRLGWTRFIVPDPSFGWYMRSVALVAVGAAAAFGGLLWWYHGKLLDLLGLYDMLGDPAVQGMLHQYSKLSLLVTGIAVLGAAFFVILMAMFLLHRITGPVYRIKLHMIDIMAGTPPRELKFRDGDQLRDLADIFNEFMAYAGILPDGRASDAQAEGTEPAPPAAPRASV